MSYEEEDTCHVALKSLGAVAVSSNGTRALTLHSFYQGKKKSGTTQRYYMGTDFSEFLSAMAHASGSNKSPAPAVPMSGAIVSPEVR